MTGKSFEGSAGEGRPESEASSFVSNNNQMGWIPEDDHDSSPVFGGVASPQTEGLPASSHRGSLIPPTGREKHLAVIREDLDSNQERASLVDDRH